MYIACPSLCDQHSLGGTPIGDRPHDEQLDWDDLAADLRSPAKAEYAAPKNGAIS